MSHSDELARFEQEGHRFASALLDAGFGSQFVLDAMECPKFRIAQRANSRESITFTALLTPSGVSADGARYLIKLGHFPAHQNDAAAFYAGVMSAIESHSA
jgi:hypothetical protein